MSKILDVERKHYKFDILRELLNCFLLAIPFLVMDFYIRQLSRSINYRTVWLRPNILFSSIWMMLFVVIALSLKHTMGKIIYSICFGVFFLMFFVNVVYFPYMGLFFSFNLLEFAGEGSAYIVSTLLSTSLSVYVVILIVFLLGICVILKFPKREKGHPFILGMVFILFIILHLLIPSHFFYKNARDDTWYHRGNVYDNFNDSNKSMKLCGFYEYVVRDFYVTYLRREKEDPEQIAFLNKEFADTTTHEENEYTGIFEGKNLIFLQLEGIDSWLFNKEYMPNLYKLLENSINFEQHYSYYAGGGSTFNSEFVVNTGLLTPVSYTRNAPSFSTNTIPYGMVKMFEQLGYKINAFHMNDGEYYSRRVNYQSWGYENYYGLQDVGEYTDVSYQLDRELILNETFYEKMFCQNEPFVHYLISYTPHMPFDITDGRILLLASEKYGEDISELTEEEIVKMCVAETDYMIEMLMDALEENGLLENTVIVAYADHYLYTLTDKTILDKYKETENNLINHTPFFIWSYGMEAETLEKVNSQLDILPTVLNLFGIDYEEEYYIGHDIMDEKYSGYAFFSDYSWYDGNVYVEDGKVTNGAEVDKAYLEQTNSDINELIQRNDLVLKYDYFERLEK